MEIIYCMNKKSLHQGRARLFFPECFGKERHFLFTIFSTLQDNTPKGCVKIFLPGEVLRIAKKKQPEKSTKKQIVLNCFLFSKKKDICEPVCWDNKPTKEKNHSTKQISTLRIIGPSSHWRHFEDLNTPASYRFKLTLPLKGPSDP